MPSSDGRDGQRHAMKLPFFRLGKSILHYILQHLGETTQSKSSVEEAVNAVGWVHQISGLPSISASPFVRATLAGLQRNFAMQAKSKKGASDSGHAIGIGW